MPPLKNLVGGRREAALSGIIVVWHFFSVEVVHLSSSLFIQPHIGSATGDIMVSTRASSSDAESSDQSDELSEYGQEALLRSYNSIMAGMFQETGTLNAIAGPSKQPGTALTPSNLDLSDLSVPDEPDRPRTKAEKLNAKKKRRNERRREEKAAELAQVEAERRAEAQAKPIRASIWPPSEERSYWH